MKMWFIISILVNILVPANPAIASPSKAIESKTDIDLHFYYLCYAHLLGARPEPEDQFVKRLRDGKVNGLVACQ